MNESKKRLLSMSYGIHLPGKQCLKTEEDWKHINEISYPLTIGSIMYFMLCKWSNVSYALSVINRYQANLKFSQDYP